MEYFLLKPFEGGCRFKIVNHDKDILICSMVKKGEAPDFTLHPCPLISNRFKELLEQFLRDMDFIPCVIEGQDQPDYWGVHPKEQDVKKARFGPDGSVTAVGPMGLTPIFMVPNYKKVSYVVNLALAESLLRRGIMDFKLELLPVKG